MHVSLIVYYKYVNKSNKILNKYVNKSNKILTNSNLFLVLLQFCSSCGKWPNNEVLCGKVSYQCDCIVIYVEALLSLRVCNIP